jgi:hypothetical protein
MSFGGTYRCTIGTMRGALQEVVETCSHTGGVVSESEHFYAKAALGHFVFGYTLIVPKEHFLSFDRALDSGGKQYRIQANGSS